LTSPEQIPHAVAIIGAGAWGTSLASVLADRYREVALWVFEPDLATEMADVRENRMYLPGVRLPEAVRPTSSLEEALTGKPLVVFVVPSHVLRGIIERARLFVRPGVVLVSATKGLEVESLCTMSQIMQQVLAPAYHPNLAVLSGPSFAREVAARCPTAVVAAADHPAVAETVQRAVSGGRVDGLALGTNARAALVTRGLAEMTRLGVAMGAQAGTFAGLAGMGDLILTCTGDLSRNRSFGRRLAEGARPEELLATARTVAEGVNACRSVVRLAERHRVEMPICQAVHRVLFARQDPRGAVERLMGRDLRFEGE
jgi:glycerol-3-phosphate dehydrogenase (NAD(P)+)